MNMIRRSFGGGFTCLVALVLAGCASTEQAENTTNHSASLTWEFRTKDGERIPGEPAPCGPEIPVQAVDVLNVAKEDDPRQVVLSSFPGAQFATEDHVLLTVKNTPAQTRKAFSQYLASRGCDVVIFGEYETLYSGNSYGSPYSQSSVMTLRVIWGTRGAVEDSG